MTRVRALERNPDRTSNKGPEREESKGVCQKLRMEQSRHTNIPSERERPCGIGTGSYVGQRNRPLRREVKEAYHGVGILCKCHMRGLAEVQ